MSTLTLDIRPLSTALQQKAVTELNEVPERLSADIANLREWLQKQPHLKARTHDQFLLNFLRGCKFSLEKAKRKLDQYYTLRTALPDLNEQRFVEDQRIRVLIRLAVVLYLPLPFTADGPSIVLIRPGKYDPNLVNMTELLRVAFILHDICFITDDNAIVSGVTQLVDLADFNMAHFLQLNPSVLKRFGLYAEEGIPLRIKNSHFLNMGALFEKLLALLKLLLPAKMVERFKVHSNIATLCVDVPLKYLPTDYGGENGSVDEMVARAEQLFLDYREYLLEEKNYGVNESLRVGGALKLDTLFGVNGSFRKLDVD